MERLTKKDEYGNADILGVDSRDLLNLDFGSFNKVTNALNKLAEYEDLEEQGMLLRLPCRVGSEVYFIRQGAVYENIGSEPTKFYEIHSLKFTIPLIDDIGKTIFLTREEAEEELKKMKKGA